MNEANNNPSIVIARNPQAGNMRWNSVAICWRLWLPVTANRLPQYSRTPANLTVSCNDVRFLAWSYKIMLLGFLLLSLPSSLFSQNPKPENTNLDHIDFNSVDQETYKYYNLKNWDSLIIIGREAIKQNIDYYYLRMRLGTAYYEKRNYMKAANNFEKALKFSGADATAFEYLYYCYVFTNREEDARLLSKQFPESLNKKINPPKSKPIDEIYMETGPVFSNNISVNEKNNLMGKDSLYGMQDLNDDKYYFHLGLKKKVGKRTSFYLGYSNLVVSKLKQIQTSEVVKSGYDTIHSNGWYYVDTLYSKTFNNYDHNYKLYQDELYLNANIAFGNGFTLVPAAHFVMVKYNQVYANSNQVEYYAQSYDTIPSLKREFTYHQSDTSFVNFVGWMALYKNISNFRLGLSGSFSNLNGKKQAQLGGELIWFPHGNINLYSVSSFVIATDNKKMRPVFEEKVGGRISEKLWAEGSFSLGSRVNYTERNAFVVNNSGDKINFRAGANLILSLSSKIEISLRYQFLGKSTYWYRLFNDGTYSNTEINYQNNQLIGGIKWKL